MLARGALSLADPFASAEKMRASISGRSGAVFATFCGVSRPENSSARSNIMAMTAATPLRDRSIVAASALCMLCSLLFLGIMPEGTPITMLVAAKSAMMVALLGLRAAARLTVGDEDMNEEVRGGR
jgi:hypothetical protein